MEKYQKLFNWVLCLLIVITAACKSGGRYLTPGENRLVNDGVRLLTTHIADDVSKMGPKAWLNYFDESPDFFLANDGRLGFKNNNSAAAFINEKLVKYMKQAALSRRNMCIDALSTDMASIHEDTAWADGKTNKVDGYFTATALFNGSNWKLRNLHWSIKALLGGRN